MACQAFRADRAGRAALKLVGGEGADVLGEVRGGEARWRRGRRGDGGEKKGGGEAILHGQFPVVGVETAFGMDARVGRSEEHTSELQSLMRISYAVFCLKKKTTKIKITIRPISTITQHKKPRQPDKNKI